MNLGQSFGTVFAGLLTLSSVPFSHAAGLTAEAVLGDYQSDPLFGEAAAHESVVIEVGTLRFVPKQINVPTDTNIRFVFTNSSFEPHLMVMALDFNEVLADHAFINEFLEHGSQEISVPGGHSHGNSSSDDASPMVKLINEHPAVFLKPGDTKEILVKFSDNQPVQIACALDNHHNQGMSGAISPTRQHSQIP
ncbi:cupredoxin domain-containing protein [Alkalimarinus alittae]|uniref:Copper-binding protein n=1 Tax=Alkalimarinus alittae TaxID=2961619 RepID=A0ABY6MZM8_9ALTE|nr:hypothetical protein [Alkalimarinus alittae]UZE95300.1 hypothetical protein NKI27_14690 [Alkalimarinus alittae]